MKKTFLLFSALIIFINLFADELVLIPVKTNQEIRSLAGDGRLTINYLGNGFLLATKHGEIRNNYTVLDNQAWSKDHAYFLVYAEKQTNEAYRLEIAGNAEVIFQNNDLLFIKAGIQQLEKVQPPVNGSMVRVWNRAAVLPDNSVQLSFNREADPFIEARMAEVNTTLMQTNIQHLQDYGTRNAYTTQSVQAQSWIMDQFISYGMSTSLFDFTMPNGSASDNVIAVKTGSLYPYDYVVIGGHYDSYSGSSIAPGADDNASGTCGVLEVARILGPFTFDRTIIFCAFSGEEYGLYGSEAYAAWCESQDMHILGYMNMDMIGYLKPGDPVHTDMIAPASAQSLVDFYTNVVNLYLPEFTVSTGTLVGGDSDHTSFNNHGFKGIFPFEDSQDYSPYIHSTNDIIGPSVNNFEQVGVFTKAMVAATISLANMPLVQNVTVTGTVTDLNTGMPLEGAFIQVVYSGLPPVSTNSSGQYTISSIPTGFYSIRVSKAGYATINQIVTITETEFVFDFQLEESIAWGFEIGSFEPNWTFGGAATWNISMESPLEGNYCSKSGSIGNSQNTDMSIELFLASAGTVSFFRKVSSESGYDYLRFYIDDVQQGQWSGTVDWSEVNFPVTAGLHTFRWSYSKDGSEVAGSDCAWVDYIIFPPVAPIPDPANIVFSPSQFTKTIGLNGNASDILTIENTGETNLDYTASIEYNASQGRASATVYPINADYNTGTTTTSAKTQTSLVKGYPTTEAGWMKFDMSSIPDGATINSIEFHGYVNATYYPYWNINPVTVDPVTATPSDLYTDIMAESAAGYYLYRSENGTYSTGWKVHALGGNANANLQAALSQNWFAIGVMDRDVGTNYFIGFDGWNEVNKPYLVIDYTYIPPYTWLTLDGSGSVSGNVIPAGNNQISVGFDAGSLTAGTYTANIRITSNDPDQPQVLVPCTLNISNDKNLNITVLLEGLHNGPGTMRKAQGTSGDQYPGTVADQMTVELHEAADYNNVVYTAHNVDLNTNGAANLVIPAENSGSYYVTIRHRNSIETTTALPVSFDGSDIIYNFTTTASQAYGSNLHQTGSEFVIFGGDVNQDGAVDTGDMTPVDNDAGSFAGGYLPTDINGDGTVDTGDITVIDNNAASFTGKATP
ncbi:MAG: M28 family peptidase [Bacteroidota bacterium]